MWVRSQGGWIGEHSTTDEDSGAFDMRDNSDVLRRWRVRVIDLENAEVFHHRTADEIRSAEKF